MSTARAFDRLEREFFNGWVRHDPMRAVDFGLTHGNDARLPDGSAEKIEDEIAFLHRIRNAFLRINPATLSASRRVDHDLALALTRQWLFEREDLRMWERVPEGPRLLCDAIFQILGRSYAPLKVRLRVIMERLAHLPKFLEQTKSRLRRPARLYIEQELETITRIPSFFHNVREIGRLNMPVSAFNVLAKLLEENQTAIESYCNWLIIDILSECGNDYAIDPSLYSEYLRVRGIRDGPETLVKWGERELDHLKARLREQGRKIRRKVPVEDVRARIKTQHPNDFDGVLKFTRDQVSRARDFVQKSGFATLPSGDHLFVVETPTYLRHFNPFTSYGPPGRFAEKMEAYFFVTPGDCDSHQKLNEYSYPALSNFAIHESYPGHHLQQTGASRHPSLLRSLSRAPETIEGWAHYCEERVRDMGYDVTPPIRFMQTVGLLWRAARMSMDVRLCTGKLAPGDAANLLIDEVGMDRVGAEAEVRRYLVTPTYALSYLYGKEAIKDLKKEMRAKMKARFTEKFFHDSIIASGSLPMALLRRELEWRATEELKKPPPPTPPPPEVVKKKEKRGPPVKAKPAAKEKAEVKPAPAPTIKVKARPKKKTKPKKKIRAPTKRKPKPKKKLRTRQRPKAKKKKAKKRSKVRRPRRAKSKPRRRR